MNKKDLKESCPECGAEISIETGAQKGEVVTCPECTTDLEIVSLNPLKIKKAPEAQEDWGQ